MPEQHLGRLVQAETQLAHFVLKRSGGVEEFQVRVSGRPPTCGVRLIVCAFLGLRGTTMISRIDSARASTHPGELFASRWNTSTELAHDDLPFSSGSGDPASDLEEARPRRRRNRPDARFSEKVLPRNDRPLVWCFGCVFTVFFYFFFFFSCAFVLRSRRCRRRRSIQPVADGAGIQGGSHAGIHPHESQAAPPIPDFAADFSLRPRQDSGHVPVAAAAEDLVHEEAEDRATWQRYASLGGELHPVELRALVGHCGDRSGFGC